MPTNNDADGSDESTASDSEEGEEDESTRLGSGRPSAPGAGGDQAGSEAASSSDALGPHHVTSVTLGKAKVFKIVSR